VFNLQGSELIIILLLALVVLGPEKLPDAMRKAGQFYAELKKMSSGFQSEFKAAVEEPLNELKNTANTLRDSADFTKLQNGERAEKPKSAEMVAAPDPDVVPTDDLPFTAEAAAAGAGALVESQIVESDIIATDPAESEAAESEAAESEAAESKLTDTDLPQAAAPPAARIPAPPKPFSSSQQLSTSLPAQPDAADTSTSMGEAVQTDDEASATPPVDAEQADDEAAERPE
jgi:sec-independent protein translocase protein TatB